MAAYFEGSEERSEAVSALFSLKGFEIYGPAPAAAVEQLRQEADAHGLEITVHAAPIAGFLRSVA